MSLLRSGSIGLLLAFAAMALSPGAADADWAYSAIGSNFNGTDIAAGNSIWFNCNFKYTGPTDVPVTIDMMNSTISFVADGVPYVLNAPDTRVLISPAVADASVDFDEVLNRWYVEVPSDFGDDIFLNGMTFMVPVDLPGGINPVLWEGRFGTSTEGVQVQWKWGAAVYTDFTDDYDLLGVTPIHDGYHAGTPVNYIDYVIGGARGGGGSNYTGSWSGTGAVFDIPVPVQEGTWGQLKQLY